MAKIYSNENIRKPVIDILKTFGHDILTSYEAGNANLSISDFEVLNFAIQNKRIVLTFNRKDFIKLHNKNNNHFGIIVCTEDKNNIELANRIHNEILKLNQDLSKQLIRVNRPII